MLIGPDGLLAAESYSLRPGLELVAIDDAALPMAWLAIEVLAQERKSLPLLDEFVLRLVAEGVDTVALIAQVLGIDEKLVSATVADQLVVDRLARIDGPDGTLHLRLTPTGLDIARDMAAVVPKEQIVGYAFDLLMKRVTAYPRSLLINPQQTAARSLRRLPKAVTTVADGDVTAAALNQLLFERRSDESAVEILACRRVMQKASLYLPVKLMIYTDSHGREAQLAVVIEGEVSRAHELELSQVGGADRIKLRVEGPSLAPRLDAELERERVSRDEVHALWLQACGRFVGSGEGEPTDAEIAEASRMAQQELDRLSVRSVDTFEFPELLLEAATTAKSRILVMSRRLDLVASDEQVVDALEQRARTGVDIRIAYNVVELGPNRSMTRRLVDLERRHSSIQLSKIDWEPAETLVWDHVMVTGTYPWLSARSDLDRPRRREDGTLVRRRNVVDRQYDQHIERIRGRS